MQAETIATEPVAEAVPVSETLAGGSAEAAPPLAAGGKHRHAAHSVHVGYTKRCPAGTERVRQYSKYTKKMIKTTRCSKSKYHRRRGYIAFGGGEDLQGGRSRRRRSRSRSRRH